MSFKSEVIREWLSPRLAACISNKQKSDVYKEAASNFNRSSAALRSMMRRIRERKATKNESALLASDSKEDPRKTTMDKEEGKDTSVITTRSCNITTLEAALAFAKVDLNVWEVERHVINNWEVTMRLSNDVIKEGEKLKKEKADTYTNVQVKVWLKRKGPVECSLQTLLKEIKAHSPLIPAFKHVLRAKHAPRRSLEIDMMDVHNGLNCEPPEADAPWSIELAAATVKEALECLIERTKAYSPFEEVFVPFGNDWVHSDTVFHTTTAGTLQPESMDWHHTFVEAEKLAIWYVNRLREIAPVTVYQIPGNHSRIADFTMGRLLNAHFHAAEDVKVMCDSSPYKFHRFGKNLIGFEHGHSVSAIRLAALMANECPKDWSETVYREFHLGDQHRKGTSKPSALEEQGVSIEYIPSLVAPNSWHRLKGFSHQKRGAMAFVWDANAGQIARFLFNIDSYTHKGMKS